jgi:hypothetical protein
MYVLCLLPPTRPGSIQNMKAFFFMIHFLLCLQTLLTCLLYLLWVAKLCKYVGIVVAKITQSCRSLRSNYVSVTVKIKLTPDSRTLLF